VKQLHGLSRRIALTVASLVLFVMLATVASTYVFYALMFRYAPSHMSDADQWLPTDAEWGWIGATTAVAVVLAIAVAVRLSRRLLVPLTSVADGLRRVSRGDLEARASGADSALGEASHLVDDFNTMAERLRRMAREQAFWNAAIAHELRTPVTILRGRLQGLADGVFEPDVKLFRNLLGQVEHLGGLIEDLRVVGLAESGHLTLRLAPCRLADELGSVVDLLAPDLRAAGFEPVVDLDGGAITCDAARIRQALLALLDNVRRHALPGALAVRLRLARGQAHLTVTDSGPGIDPALAASIFDAFQRGDKARADAGSGLGLAVVRAIAQAHGGLAACRPAAHGGTTFEMAWPATHDPVPSTHGD
jgi:two-component system sensor histidine kinase AdeS